MHRQIAIAALVFSTAVGFASQAAAQAGAACGSGILAPTACGLGGQIRAQLGYGLPLPLSIDFSPQGASGPTVTSGPFTGITIRTVTATPSGLGQPQVGQGLGQRGQLKPLPSATIMQAATPGSGPRQLTLVPGVFHAAGQGSFAFNFLLFATQTQGVHDFPHPGTTVLGAQAFTEEFGTVSIPTPNANVLFAGGRIGAKTVTYYADASAGGSPTNNYGRGVPPTNPATGHDGLNGPSPVHGIARFTATRNQFGGQAIPRRLGTVRRYFNRNFLFGASLPCKVSATAAEGTTAQGFFVPFNTGSDCEFSLSIKDAVASNSTVGVAGGAFNGLHVDSEFVTATGVFTGTIGFNGTIIGQGAPVTISGMGIPFAGEAIRHTVGFPMTTGRLTISVTHTASGTASSRFVRTGIDARDANGNGVVALVTGSLTSRRLDFAGTPTQTWITLEIPEPIAALTSSVALLTLFGCHRFARSRFGSNHRAV